MKLNSPVPHKKARIEIIPLIDIMFFLLASFMLVSLSMIRMKGVKMSLPQTASATTENNPDFIPISVSPTGEIFWDKERMQIAAGDLTGKIAPLYQANKDLRILINADRDATHGVVMGVLDRVRQAGVTKVTFGSKSGSSAPAPEGGGISMPPIPPLPPAAPAAPLAPLPPMPVPAGTGH